MHLQYHVRQSATFVFLGRPYKYGSQHLISETSTPKPNSNQGSVLEQIEQQIHDAAIPGSDGASLVKTRIICHSFPFGPSIGDGLLEKKLLWNCKKLKAIMVSVNTKI